MKRHLTQFGFFLLTNFNIGGFITGRTYKGPLKSICVPGLNCYSCPGALGACPIGAIQAVIGSAKYQFSLYVTGLFMLFGAALGRFVCGFLCPFGLVQDLIDKIKARKLRVPVRIDRPLRNLKYVVLLVMVILLPMVLTNEFGMASPFFCQYICPSGTLFGGIPLLIANSALRDAAGFLFSWKMGVLVLLLGLSAFIYRPFCKYVCPLGAVYALFNGVSVIRISIDRHKCDHCGQCERACPMQVPVEKKPNHTECIRCGVCEKACTRNAIKRTGLINFKSKRRPKRAHSTDVQ